jgi:hypothetical protein
LTAKPTQCLGTRRHHHLNNQTHIHVWEDHYSNMFPPSFQLLYMISQHTIEYSFHYWLHFEVMGFWIKEAWIIFIKTSFF